MYIQREINTCIDRERGRRLLELDRHVGAPDCEDREAEVAIRLGSNNNYNY